MFLKKRGKGSAAFKPYALGNSLYSKIGGFLRVHYASHLANSVFIKQLMEIPLMAFVDGFRNIFLARLNHFRELIN